MSKETCLEPFLAIAIQYNVLALSDCGDENSNVTYVLFKSIGLEV